MASIKIFNNMLLLFTTALLVSISQTVHAADTNDVSQDPTYEQCKDSPRAIVVGSSVSLGFFGPSPAILYLERAGFLRDCILKKTLPITDSHGKLSWLKKTVTEFKPNLIVGLDLLFHDISFLRHEEKIAARVSEIEETLDFLNSTQIPVLIGTVFALEAAKYPFRLNVVKTTNQQLCDLQEKSPGRFTVLPTARIYREIYSGQFLARKGQQEIQLSKRDLLVDQFHLGPRGSYLVTNRLIHILNNVAQKNGFAYPAKPYNERLALGKPLFAFTQRFDNYAHPVNLLFEKIPGSDTLATVNETTIPSEIGDEACSSDDGYERPSP
jgi:hypothetical protein